MKVGDKMKKVNLAEMLAECCCPVEHENYDPDVIVPDCTNPYCNKNIQQAKLCWEKISDK